MKLGARARACVGMWRRVASPHTIASPCAKTRTHPARRLALTRGHPTCLFGPRGATGAFITYQLHRYQMTKVAAAAAEGDLIVDDDADLQVRLLRSFVVEILRACFCFCF